MPDLLKANVDLMANGQAQGDVAGRFQSAGKLNSGIMRPFLAEDENGNMQAYVSVYVGGPKGNPKKKDNWRTHMVNNATLRRDEWKQLDQALIEEAKYNLGGFDDVISRGLVYNLGNAMGTTVLEWHDMAGSMDATMSMDGLARGATNNRPNFQYNYLPIPIIHVDYEINARELENSRSLGNPLDTTKATMATRAIKEKLENMLFTDTTYSFGETDSRGRNKIYSYLNFPDRNLVNLSIPWDNSACTGPMIVQDVMDMKEAARLAYKYGPFVLYIPSNYEKALDEDYNATTAGTTSTITVRDRVLKIAGISAIKAVDTLPDGNILLVQMRPDTIRIVNGMGLTNLQWGEEGNLVTKFKVMTIQVPQIRSDQNGKCGIVHMS